MIEQMNEENLRLTALLDEGQGLISEILSEMNIPYQYSRQLDQWVLKANAEMYRQFEDGKNS